MQTIEKWSLWLGYNLRLAAFSQTLPAFSEKAGRFRPETGSQPTGSSAIHLPDVTVYFQFRQSAELSRYFRGLALPRAWWIGCGRSPASQTCTQYVGVSI